MFEREQEKRENESKAEVEDEYIYGRDGEEENENEDNCSEYEGEYENVKEGTNQLSLNLRQHVLLIVPLWCFRLTT